MNRTAIAIGAALLALGAGTAIAATRDTGVPPASLNGVTHAVKTNGALKARSVGHLQLKNQVIDCEKLTFDLANRVCRGLPGGPGAPGANGANGTNGSPGAQGPPGDLGAPGAKGDKGAAGDKGAKGDTGANGATGATGATGAPGPTGQPGPQGVPGTPGATGATGPAGADAHNPLVFGPYNSGSTDSSVCGGDWANDTYTRTYIVSPQSDGSFQVTELFNGSFVTLAGNSPNDTDCATTADDVAAGITGSFHGDYALVVPAPADFDPTATCPAGCTTSDFFTTFFGSGFPATFAWSFYYSTASHGSWANTDHGNSGNIT